MPLAHAACCCTTVTEALLEPCLNIDLKPKEQ
jgi:hypothetical protein